VGDDPSVRDVSISDEMIRLGQLLKLTGVVQSGGDVKSFLATGSVLVNGEVETRRGRRLHRGDLIAVDSHQLRVV
jgi:ribosome-associated protein